MFPINSPVSYIVIQLSDLLENGLSTWISVTAKGLDIEQYVDLHSPVPGIAGLQPVCPNIGTQISSIQLYYCLDFRRISNFGYGPLARLLVERPIPFLQAREATDRCEFIRRDLFPPLKTVV